jgi:hypothetical protein
MTLAERQLDAGRTRTHDARLDLSAAAVEDANLGPDLQPEYLDQVFRRDPVERHPFAVEELRWNEHAWHGTMISPHPS